MTSPREEARIPYQEAYLAAGLHRPAGEPRSAVVMAHGLLSSMASEKLTRLADALAGAGYLVCRYDAAGCGGSPGRIEDTTLGRRRDELLAAAGWLAQRHPELDQAYLGSSLGGSAALLAADQRPPQALICWSTPIYFSALHPEPGGPDLSALRREAPGHDLAAVLRRTSRLLVVHGAADEVVPADQAQEAHRLAVEPKDLLMLPGGDHRLTKIEDQQLATARTLGWLERMLSPVG